MPKRLAVVSVLSLLFTVIALGGPIVVDEVETFSDRECQWLHSQFLGECMSSQKCERTYGEMDDFSMSTYRGMSSLETVITVRAMEQINSACQRVCLTKQRPAYGEWRKLVCDPLIKRPASAIGGHHDHRAEDHPCQDWTAGGFASRYGLSR
jgi:hypothetical protein